MPPAPMDIFTITALLSPAPMREPSRSALGLHPTFYMISLLIYRCSWDETCIAFPATLCSDSVTCVASYPIPVRHDASESWRLSMRFISIVLLSTVGNAAEHAGAVTFAVKNKLDVSLGVSLGSATQISMFVVPSSVIVSWMMGVPTDLDFKILEIASLVLSIVITGFALQDGTSHYLQGLAVLLAYIIIGACFFFLGSGEQ